MLVLKNFANCSKTGQVRKINLAFFGWMSMDVYNAYAGIVQIKVFKVFLTMYL